VIDLRYHVFSLVAVFVFFVVGVVVGVGLSGQGFVEEGERRRLNAEIERLRNQRDDAEARAEALEAQQRAGEEYVQRSYPVLMQGRLDGLRIARVVVGEVDERAADILDEVDRALADAGGSPARLRALRVPVDHRALADALSSRPDLSEHSPPTDLRRLGRALARELVSGGETPLWDALSPVLVAQRSGSMSEDVDGVVVARSAPPQRGRSADFVRGFYEGLDEVPAVGVEETGAERSAIAVFARADLSTVDHVDTQVGRLALALLLAGASPGDYGVKDTAAAALPPVDPIPPPAGD
jgi:hypothetical protein